MSIVRNEGRNSQRIKEGLRCMDQRLAGLEHDARQPRLAMEAGGHANTKTRERTEGAATAVQAMHGDSCSTTRIDPGPKTNSTSFGVKAEPPALPNRDGVVVENGAAAPKSCLSSLEMRSPKAACGLLSTSKISTATKTTFNKSPLRLYSTEKTNSKETNLWTSVPSALYDSNFRKLPAVPFCRRVIETKSIQNRMFDPGGFQGRLRACPFLGSWNARCFVGRLMLGLDEAAAVFGGSMIRDPKPFRGNTGKLFTPYV